MTGRGSEAAKSTESLEHVSLWKHGRRMFYYHGLPHLFGGILVTHTHAAQWTQQIMLFPTFLPFLWQVKEPPKPRQAVLAYKIKSKGLLGFLRIQTAFLPPTPSVQPLMCAHFLPHHAPFLLIQIHAGCGAGQFSRVTSPTLSQMGANLAITREWVENQSLGQIDRDLLRFPVSL